MNHRMGWQSWVEDAFLNCMIADTVARVSEADPGEETDV